MYEAMATVVGTVVTNPVKRDLSNGEQVLTFRMASNSRRLDFASGEWVDNGTLYLTISCWRRLVGGVDASLRRGDPVLVYGQLRSHEYRTKDGVERRDLEMRATAVGPDLSRCTAQVSRRSETGGGPTALMRNTCIGSSAENRARVGEELGDSAATVASVPSGSAAPEPVDA
ncbi:single-strand DNA-binding protein [Nocardia amikacinitolerans]|uniref:single-stranded DNA-binding protein n=1 Tax=Nocardia amikacinitolerans TaxID=756689 RepID=UPI0009FE8FC4|nr:single-stranded DNA-binding protein [Nocardia amikacinitolerans]MCP2318676.1 single-strand DNA-binding protein [Nocardia amikacinitolerans]